MTAVVCHRDGDLAEVVLNRPEKRNALRERDVLELRAALRASAGGPHPARALLLRGNGQAFCAGRDLSDAAPGTEDGGAILRDIINPLIAEVAGLPLPTIAAVQGACVGAGLGLALACDLVIAAADARLGSPFARIGAVLDSGAHRFLVDRIGPARTLELIYTGRLLSGREAAEAGLVNACVPDDELAARARGLATGISHGPTAAFAASKRLVRRIENAAVPLDEVLEAEARAQSEACGTQDYQNGIRAFQQKSAAHFSGR
jgi:enoyl-CoA hydratase/carnithine racemase